MLRRDWPAYSPGAQPEPDSDDKGFLQSPWETPEKGEVPRLLLRAPQEEHRLELQLLNHPLSFPNQLAQIHLLNYITNSIMFYFLLAH